MSTGDWTSRGPDFTEEYRQQAKRLAQRFAVMEGVVGVVLVGGLTFGTGDRYSSVDLIVYLQHQSLRTWYYGEAPLPEGESRYHNLRLDTSYRDFRKEQEREWTSTEVWKVSRADVLYDPEGLLRALIDTKVKEMAERAETEALDRATSIRSLLDRSVVAWLYRGDPLTAHHVLNQALDELIGLLHLVNGRPVPGPDWNLASTSQLEWKPERFDERIRELLKVGELTSDEASRRRHMLFRLLQECWGRIAPGEPFEDRADIIHQARMLAEMAQVGAMSLHEYRQRFEPRLLIQSPAFELLWVDRSGAEPAIRFNYERLEQIINHQLGQFIDYQQRLLRQLAASSGTDVDS